MFGVEQVTLRRNGLPKASTPISTQDHKRLFFNTLSALGLLHCGLGITLDNYQQHFILCFVLTSTQQAAHGFLHPELTNCSVSLDLQFSNALTANLEVFVWGIRSSNLFITSDRKVTRNVLPISTVWKWMKSSCRTLFRIVNIWNISFLEYLQRTIFHLASQTIYFWLWTLQNQILRGPCNRRNVVYFADPLGLPRWQYTNLYKRLNENFHQVTELMTNFPMQDSKSTMCDSFCNYIAHLIYAKNINDDNSGFVYINDHVLKRFLTCLPNN